MAKGYENQSVSPVGAGRQVGTRTCRKRGGHHPLPLSLQSYSVCASLALVVRHHSQPFAAVHWCGSVAGRSGRRRQTWSSRPQTHFCIALSQTHRFGLHTIQALPIAGRSSPVPNKRVQRASALVSAPTMLKSLPVAIASRVAPARPAGARPVSAKRLAAASLLAAARNTLASGPQAVSRPHAWRDRTLAPLPPPPWCLTAAACRCRPPAADPRWWRRRPAARAAWRVHLLAGSWPPACLAMRWR